LYYTLVVMHSVCDPALDRTVLNTHSTRLLYNSSPPQTSFLPLLGPFFCFPGIPTVAVFSEADRGAAHVDLADEAFCIGPARAADSYLRQDRILEVGGSQ